MNHTTNYQLPKWEKTDRIQMKDFNDMTATLDAALAGMPKLALGTYTGTGEKGQSAPTSLTLSFPPKFLAVFPINGLYRLLCARGMEGSNTSPNGHSYGNVAVAWDGSTVSWHTTDSGAGADFQLNRLDTQYFYIALG